MLKKTIVFGILILMIAVPAVFGQADDVTIGFGVGAFNSWYNMKSNDSAGMSGGLQMRWKFSRFLGLSGDMIYQGDMFYYEDPLESVWVGPTYWEDVPSVGYGEDDWAFSHSEFVMMFNLCLNIPLGFVQPYLSIGPAYYVYMINNELDNEEFQQYFDDLWGGYDGSLGYSIKAGADFFLCDWASLGFAVDFIVDDLDVFFQQVDNGFADPDYVNENSFVELNFLFWI